jgi:hypothetical protein
MVKLSTKGRAALIYAVTHDLTIFRCRPGTKEPYGGEGEIRGATKDPEVIERLWWETPNAEIAVSLRYTPFFVLDPDARHFGDEWLDSLEVLHGRLPHTVTSISGSGYPSMHLWFRRSPELGDVQVKALTHGVDIKGLRTGYVLLPPSSHAYGRTYGWEASSRIGEVPVADSPPWLDSMIKRKATRFTEVHEFTNPVDPESFFLGAVFKRAGLLGRRLGNGKWAALCPNEGSHSKGSSTSSSVLFAPKHPGGRGTFFCSHTTGCAEVYR